MSMGIIYLVVIGVSLVCGFLSMKKPNSKTSLIAVAVLVAACGYATYYYTWFHILGLVGVTLVGVNAFSAVSMLRQSRANEKARIDEIFKVDDEDLKEEDGDK